MSRASADDRPVAVVGGAGFIGSNLAASYLMDGRRVLVVDNLARAGVEANLQWLAGRFGSRLSVARIDVRDRAAIAEALAPVGAVFHLAAQVAVTTSLADPVADFEINAAGTLSVLEAVRATGRPVPVVFASTNKVYGALSDVPMDDGSGRWRPADPALAAHGLSETRGLDFCTPYGCSKGVADQYVLDYAKSYGLPTAVLRMSCIYGPRQFGTEDQGWVAHFMIRAMRGEPITLFGDGRQVRDVLHVTDAVAAYRSLLAHAEDVAGHAFNLGGGPDNAVSLGDVLGEIEAIVGAAPPLDRAPWRTGDQPWFVADTRRIERAVGWSAAIGWRDGLRDLAAWLRSAGLDRATHPENRRIPA